MERDDLPADKLVLVYRKIRGVIDAKEDAHKAEITGLKDQLDLVEAKLLDICNQQGVESLRTANGTATRSVRTRYNTSDWEAMYSFIGKHSAPYLLERRIHSGNMKEFLDEYPDTELPPGLSADSKYSITVRKPSNK